MKVKRIGVAINARHLRAEDQLLYHGVRDYSRTHEGFECVLAPFAAEDLKESCKSKNLPYDGILAQATPELVDIAKKVKVPIVDVWFDSEVTVPISCVFSDFAKAGRMVGQHLVSRGFEHFGYVINRRSQSQAMMCNGKIIKSDSLGFESYIKARGFKCSHFLAPRNVNSDALTWRNWSKAILEWIRQQPTPLALFVPSDMLCRHIADIAPELGLNVPQDLGLVCADNEPNLCLLTEPSLSSVDLGYRRIGYEAAAMLDHMLKNPEYMQEREIKLLDPQFLHPRHSTDATNVKDALVSTAMRYILDNSNQAINVKDVIKQTMTTRRTLERRFREVLNRTIMQEITRCRIERLKRRLAESDEQIKIIALDSGFNSVRMLYQTFIREEGISPSAYRAKRRCTGVSNPVSKALRSHRPRVGGE